MGLKQTDINNLKRMMDFESTMDDNQKKLGWSWQEVMTSSATINRYMLDGLVELRYSSNRYKNYMLTDAGIETIKTELAALSEAESSMESSIESLSEESISELFEEVIGHDDIKELLREVLLAEEPIHVLLYGPPAIAKSMFLVDIEKAAGSLALPLLGSSTSHAGMWDLLAERRPHYVLIDEVEKMGLTDIAGLLSLMENQRIIRAKVGRKLDEHLDCRVIAAANRIDKLPPEFLSRCWKWRLEEYSSADFVKVVESVLANREELSISDAKNIAMGIVGRTHDVRDAVRVARLSKRVGVNRALELFCKQ
jgi:Holliday junction DNA helicase RuvB